MSRAFHEVSPYRTYPFEEKKVRALWEKYRLSPTEVVVILGKAGEQVVATIVAATHELYFGPTKVAGEIIWWVDPEYRNTKLGFKLFKAFEFWGEQVGADVLNGTNTEATTPLVKFYERNGYHLAESTFIKDLK